MPDTATATDLPSWESLIAARKAQHPDTSDQRIQDPSARNMRIHGRRYDNSEKGRARHRAYAHSDRGREKSRKRSRRYAMTEKGKATRQRKDRKFRETHRDDPAWKEWRDEYHRAWRAVKRASRLTGVYTLHLMGETITIHMQGLTWRA